MAGDAAEAGIVAADGVRRTVLPGGARVVTEHMPDARSVSTGCWVTIGGRDEPGPLSGASHFCEHLLFKGTADRRSHDIAEWVDSLGGEMNAFTTKEYTAYYTRLPDHAMDEGLDLLCDVIAEPAFRPDDLEVERQVILEELAASEDAPDDLVHTRLFEALFPEHPLGREVLGTRATVRTVERDQIAGFHLENYRAPNLVVAAAGNLRHDSVVERVARRLDAATGGAVPERMAPLTPPQPLAVVRRPVEQGHVALGWRSLDHHDPDRYALAACNQVLGGGLSSRLFEEVRERRGLAYSVFSSPAPFSDSGALTVYAATSPDRADELLTVLDAEISRLKSDGLTEKELSVAKGYLEGSLVLGLEDSGGRMARIGSSEAVRGEVTPIDEHVERIRQVSLDDADRVLDRVFSGPRTLAAVGPFDEDHLAHHAT